jgi:Na+-driven multidrug efflux pump
MAFFGKYWYEAQEIAALTIPTTSATFFEASMVVVDVIMLGHLGKGHVAALAVGNGLFNAVWYFIEGFLTAQDTLCSNAYGQGDPKALRYWCYVSMFATFFLCVVATAIFFFSELILGQFFFINFHLKTKACVHIYIMTPALWLMALYRIAQKYLQSRGIMAPSAKVSLIGNAVNICFNYLFIFVLGFGFAGCAGATLVTRFVMLLSLYKYVKKSGEMYGIHAELGELLSNTSIEATAQAAARAVDDAQVAIDRIPVERTRRTVGTWVRGVGESVGSVWIMRCGASMESGSTADTDTGAGAEEMTSLLGGFFDFSTDDAETKDLARRKKSASVMPYAGYDDDKEEEEESGHGSSTHSKRSGAGGGGGPDSSEDEDEDGDDSLHGAHIRVPGQQKRHPPPSVMSPLSAFASSLRKDKLSEEEEEGGSYLDDVHISDASYHRKQQGHKKMSPEREIEKEDEEDEYEDEDEDEESDEEVVRRPLLAALGLAPEPDSPFVVGSLSIQGPRARFIIRFLRFYALGIPGGVMTGLENWMFVVLAMSVAQMGSVPLAATQILVVFTETVFLSIPFSVSVACSNRIAAALGSNNVESAKTTCFTGFAVGLPLVLGAAGIVYNMPEYLGYVFTNDGDVAYRAAMLAPIAALFQVAFGVVGLCQGVMKAQGRQAELAGFTAASLYLMGLPLAYFWGFWVRPTYGLAGLWYGLTVGMGTLALILLVLVFISDWHREGRRARFRLSRERQGFVQQPANSEQQQQPEQGVGPSVGRPMVGSRASGGFLWHSASLQEEIEEMEQVDFSIALKDAERARA